MPGTLSPSQQVERDLNRMHTPWLSLDSTLQEIDDMTDHFVDNYNESDNYLCESLIENLVE